VNCGASPVLEDRAALDRAVRDEQVVATMGQAVRGEAGYPAARMVISTLTSP
jgi:hypothetical protein